MSTGLADLLPDVARGIFLNCQSALLDQFTFTRLAQSGIVADGQCLVVGADNGSVRKWLAAAVGSNGDVTAVERADQLRRGRFDLIVCRLALANIRTPSEALVNLTDRLTPGGVLLVEEWIWTGKMLASTDPDGSTLFARYQYALVTELTAHGTDAAWADRVPAAMLDAGLVGVNVSAHAQSWPGGTPGTRLHVVVATELRDALVAAGMRSNDLQRLRDILSEPRLLLLSNLTMSVIGRRPRTPTRAIGSSTS